MSFVSFPQTELDDDQNKELTFYDKVFNAASNMLSSFRPDDGSIPQQSAQSFSSTGDQREHSRSNSFAKSYTGSTRSATDSIRRPSGLTFPSGSPTHSTVPNTPSSLAPPTPSSFYAKDSIGSIESHNEHEHRSNPTSSRNSFIFDVGPSDHSQMQFTHTSQPSIGVSSEYAVPLLPSSSSFATVSRNTSETSDFAPNNSLITVSEYAPSPRQRQQSVDVESLFSVTSRSASREYLASQYSRSRSRAQPSRLGREYWMKDESATSCFSCNRKFTTFRRKHHCRVCGQIFCSACTALIEGERCGTHGRRVRCCKACEDALALHSSSDDEVDASFLSQAPLDVDVSSVNTPPPQNVVINTTAAGTVNGSIMGSTPSSTKSVAPIHNFHSSHNSHTDNESVRQLSSSPGMHSNMMSSTSPFLSKSLSQNLVSDNEKSFRNILNDHTEDQNESYSTFASPAPIDESHFARSFLGPQHTIRTRSRSTTFREDSGPPSLSGSGVSSGSQLTSSVQRNISGSALHLYGQNSSNQSSHLGNLAPSNGNNLLTHGGNTMIQNVPGIINSSGTSVNISSSRQALARFPNSATVEMNNAARTYLLLFLGQLLKDSELNPEEWKPILTSPLLEVAAGLHLELNDRLSPREWVKIKRIPGGKPTDIDCICGTVFTHSLARRSMSLIIKNPRIMIISFPIEYARLERYMSLDPVVAQEKEYLRKLIARIAALKPTILLTCSHVCGKAMDLLESKGIAVAQNIRDSALFRLSRITRADILTSIDRLSTQPQLGTCELFEQRSYRAFEEVKTFMFFFVRPADPGRCALVRGDPEISGVIKVVLEVMAEICYSLKAETALMRDQLVNVPNITDPSPLILSSSPFVNYGTPFLEMQLNILEDRVVLLGETPPASENLDEAILNPQSNLDEANSKDKEEEYTRKTSEYIRLSNLEATRKKWLQVSRLWEGIESSYPFMFNPSSHQNLLVLYSLVCEDTATPCVGPDAQLIEFYLSTDQTLGRFVESNISLAEEKCPDGCDHKLLSHSRKYINGNGTITVSVERTPCKVSGLEDSILMWSYCSLCEQNMPVAPMSSTTWKYSMGKYLELSLYGEPLKMRASTCPHNVYRDHIRYFGWHGYALKIQYSSIQLHEITGPPAEMHYKPELEVAMKNEVHRNWQAKLDRFWQSLLDSLTKVKVEGLEQNMIELSHQKLEFLKSKAMSDWNKCISLLLKLHQESEPNDYLYLNKILEFYQQLVDTWHSDLANFDGEFFPTEKDIRRVTAMHIRGLLGDDSLDKKSRTEYSENTDNSPSKTGLSVINPTESESPISNSVEHLASVKSHETPEESRIVSEQNPSNINSNEPGVFDSNVSETSDSEDTHVNSNPQKSLVKENEEISEPNANENPKQSPVNVKSRFGNNISLSMPALSQSNSESNGMGRVAFLAKHFEELSREFERERQRANQRLKDRQKSIMMRHANTVAEVFEDVTDEIEDWPNQADTKSSIPPAANSSSNNIYVSGANIEEPDSHNSPLNQSDNDDELRVSSNLSTSSPKVASYSQGEMHDQQKDASSRIGIAPMKSYDDLKDDDDARKAEPVKMSLIRSLANFWSERSSTRWNGIEYLLSFNEHYFTNSKVVMRENEPSSLIAFSLSLPDYQSRINEFYETTPNITPSNSAEDEGNNLLEQAMLRQTGTHMRYYFDRSTVKASCKIFFSEQFDALRRKCMIPDKYIQSLSSCSSWDSSGGKSGSAFLKTSDDRLILKELSHAEFDSFINFAPSYFEYMAQALFHDLPTVLAKIFGVYQIIIRSTQKSQPIKMYVLVMENLFYGREFDKFFDLKGSMRNRKVAETGKANEVLLDENMVEYIYETPVFVREHSKRMLRASLYNDTLFLTKMNVMDYSLVIGLDEGGNTIVAGIIDYIRTYTWDKKIESWVKARAATSNIKEPTVVSPKQYKGRFRESMERYFVMVPDCWSQPIN